MALLGVTWLIALIQIIQIAALKIMARICTSFVNTTKLNNLVAHSLLKYSYTNISSFQVDIYNYYKACACEP